MKKIVFSLLFLICVCGCWNYKELNEYSIVTGIAIDKNAENYNVSVLISNVSKGNNSSSSDSSSPDIVVYQGNGNSIYEAFKDIGLVSPKELYLNSFSILIISEDVAKDGLNNILNFFLRYSSSRNNFDIVISHDCKAKDALKVLTAITNSPSQSISDNLKSTKHLQGSIKAVSIDDLVSTLLKGGIQPTISTVYLIGDEKIGSTKKNLESSEPASYIKLGNLAVFKGDKLVDIATHDESVGINMMHNQVDEVYFNLKYMEGEVVIDTTSIKTDTKISIKNRIPNIEIGIFGEMRILESKGNINLEDNKTIEGIQAKANDKLKSFIEDAINLSIKDKTDILGIGRQIFLNKPSYYNSIKTGFEDNLKKVKYSINSNVVINNKVSSKNSLEEKHDR